MRTSEDLLREVLRRASVLRARRLRRKKALLSVSCIAFSLLLMVLLSGKISLTVAVHTGSYGSLIFEGDGNQYVLVAVIAFFLGLPAGLGIDAFVRRWSRRRIDRYAHKWIGGRDHR